MLGFRFIFDAFTDKKPADGGGGGGGGDELSPGHDPAKLGSDLSFNPIFRDNLSVYFTIIAQSRHFS